MGCDIHLYTEVRVGGKWHLFSNPTMHRDYELFGWLAGVRGGDPVFEVKGFPDDAGEITRICFEHDRPNVHTPSFIGAAEIRQLYEKVKERDPPNYWKWDHEQVGYLTGNGWNSWPGEDGCYPKAIEDIRWVFWFDN